MRVHCVRVHGRFLKGLRLLILRMRPSLNENDMTTYLLIVVAPGNFQNESQVASQGRCQFRCLLIVAVADNFRNAPQVANQGLYQCHWQYQCLNLIP